MVDGFEKYEQDHSEPPVVMAPGVKRLPFFFPTGKMIINQVPTRLDELAGVTYFVDSHPEGTGTYAGISHLDNQVISASGRTDIMRRAWWDDDGIFRYTIYELHVDQRFRERQVAPNLPDNVVFGNFARLVEFHLSSDIFQIGQRRSVKLIWDVLDVSDKDYMTLIHLRDGNDTLQMTWDGPVGLTQEGLLL